MSANAPLMPGGGSSGGGGGGGGPSGCDKCAQYNWMMALRVFGGLSGCALCVLGLVNLFTPGASLSPKNVVNALYQILFGLLIIMSELRWRGITAKWFRFLTTYIGLGVFYVFVGGIALGDAWYEIVLMVVFCIAGAVYLILGCSCKDMFAQTPEEKAAAAAALAAAARGRGGVNNSGGGGGYGDVEDGSGTMVARSAYVNDKEMMQKLNQSMGAGYRTDVTDMAAESQSPFGAKASGGGGGGAGGAGGGGGGGNAYAAVGKPSAAAGGGAAATPKSSNGGGAYGGPNPFENPFAS